MADIRANLDGEILIPLIEKRSLIWDKTLETYKDKKKRLAAWHEICVIMNPDFDDMEETEKQEYAKIVVKKWNQIRDSWIRSLNTIKHAKKSGSVYVKKYRYHSQMRFLKKVIETQDVFNDTDSDDEVAQEDGVLESSKEQGASTREESSNESPILSVKRFKSTPRSMNLNVFNRLHTQSDRHMSFFKSLIPSLASFNDDEILEFQMGVLSTIQNIRSQSGRNPEEPSTSYTYPQVFYSQDSRGQSSPSTARSPSPSDCFQPSADDDTNDCKMFQNPL